MKDSSLRLQDKTILLVGPFNGITQACLRTLTEFGCDVALVSAANPGANRYVDGVNEAREVHANYGRAAFFPMTLNRPEDVQDVLGQVTHSLGRIDALVDASPLAWEPTTQPQQALDTCQFLIERCLPFLLAKQRGRILFLYEDSCLEMIRPTTNISGLRDLLLEKIVEQAKAQRSQNVTVNGVAVGVTDDFVLKTFPQGGSIKKSVEMLQKDHPGLKVVDSNDVALSVAYLASALSASVTGQVLRLTQGFHLNK